MARNASRQRNFMDICPSNLHPIACFVYQALTVYFWIIVAAVVVSLLTGFGMINNANPYVRQIRYALFRLTEPVLGPIRRVLPDLGGIDISPIIAAVLIQVIQYTIVYYGARLAS
jgi:YggT family protein